MAKVGDLFGFSLSLSWNYTFAQGIPYGWWGACKVIGKREDLLVVAALDWFGKAQPTETDVERCSVLVAPEWPHHHPGHPVVAWRASVAKPERFVRLGTREVSDAETACIEPIRSGGGWGGMWAMACAIWRWRNDRPALELSFRSTS